MDRAPFVRSKSSERAPFTLVERFEERIHLLECELEAGVRSLNTVETQAL